MTRDYVKHILWAFACVLWCVLALFVVHTSHTYAYAQEAITPCHTIASKDTTVRSGYGSVFSFFSAPSTPMLTVHCNGVGSGTVSAGLEDVDIFIYKYGYHRIDGEWEKIAFSGDNAVGPWLVGTAEASISTLDSSGEGAVVAYMCQKVDGKWRCGCKDELCKTAYWQRQGYSDVVGAIAPLEVPEDDVVVVDEAYVQALSDKFGIDTSTAQYEEDVKEAQRIREENSIEVFDVYSASASHALSGSILDLSGFDFSTKQNGNSILWDGELVARATSPHGKTLSFRVPEYEPGMYHVRVQRDGETSPNYTSVWIRDETLSTPIITDIYPTRGIAGDTFTVNGTNFAPGNNTLLTSVGPQSVIDTIGQTAILFDMHPLFGDDYFRDMDGNRVDYELEVWVMVVTPGGVSEAKMFIIDM